MRAERFFFGSSRCDHPNSDRRHRLRAAIAGAFLDFPQFAADPQLACLSVNDQDAVTMSKIFLVIFADLRLITFEDGTQDFESLFEKEIGPGGCEIGVSLIEDHI